MQIFWKFADIIRAAALAGGGFALMSTSFWGGVFICGAGAISLADIYRNSPTHIQDLIDTATGR